MFVVFLLIIPVASIFCNFNQTVLPRLHVTLYDFIVPVLAFRILAQRSLKYNFLKPELVFYALIFLGTLITLFMEPVSSINLLKDLAKLILFSMGLFVYRYYFTNWKNYWFSGVLVIGASAAIVWIDPHANDNWMYLTSFSFYIFFMYLMYIFFLPELQFKDVCFLSGITLIVTTVFIFYKRLELLGFLSLSLSIFIAERFSLKKLPLICLIGGAFVVAGYAMYYYQDVFAQSLFVRLNLWKNAWQLGLDHFPTGVGLGQYQAQGFMPEAHRMQGARCTEFQYPHNQFLYWFVEMGLIGLLLSVVFIKLVLGYLKHLPPLWKTSIFTMIMIISCTHDIISLRSFPIFLALMLEGGQRLPKRLLS
ncbi:MAG: O-antigen ligase family protein [Candidatus Paracaedibacteraceae bacterium]|nr:O-antigen ligase family protein [Candidatus Paracaedibacteraceae bacterium]